MHHWLESIITFIYPAQCRCCEQYMGVGKVHYICDDCWEQIEFISEPYCEICGKPVEPNAISDHGGTHKCRWCRQQHPKFSKARSIALYEPTLRQAIHLFKYESKVVMVKHFAELIKGAAPGLFDLSDYNYLIPVPLHKSRYAERGFNQSELLARELKNLFDIPLHIGNIIRDKKTEPQFSLETREDKFKNVENAFKVCEPEKIEWKNILLVDDIFTTGATVSEIAKTLLDKGANRVDVFTLARAG
ncbi:ComF family protein [Candidatus Poribacteria bacterium]|nr:ComF family protein [Candidatus Poribacteria bacterium]